MAVTDFLDQAQLEAWLETKTRDVSMAIAARAALRLFPLMRGVTTSTTKSGVDAAALILQSLRGMALPWAAACYPARAKEVRTASAASNIFRHNSTITAALVAASSKPIDPTSVGSMINAYLASTEAANAAAAPFHAYASAAASAAHNAALAPAAPPSSFASALQVDCEFIDGNRSARELCDRPLWQQALPNWVNQNWSQLRVELGVQDPNWDVWIRWYDAVLHGRPTPGGEVLNVFRVTLNSEYDWEKGTVYVNGMIAARETELQADKDSLKKALSLEPNPQNDIAPAFGSTGDEPIDVQKSAQEGAIPNSRDNIDGYGEAKRLLQSLLELKETEGASRNNNNQQAYERAQLLKDAMGANLQQLRPALLIPRGEALRQLLLDQGKSDPLSEKPPVSEKVKDALMQWQAAYNPFVELEPELAKRDHAILGPDAKRILVPPDEAKSMASDARNDNVITLAAEAAVNENADVAPAIPDPDNRNSRRLSETAKNLAKALVRKLQAFGRWVKANPGKVIAAPSGLYVAANWALRNADWLYKTFANNPTMLSIIKPIIDFLKTLPF